MKTEKQSFATFFWRVYATHLLSYTLLGMIASTLLDYREIFDNSAIYRAYESPWIPAGMALQIVRGLLFAIVLWFFKDVFLFQKYGWLKLWLLVTGLATLSTTAAAPGSVEGFIYTTIPWSEQIKGYLEVVPQVGLFSFLLCKWYDRPSKAVNIISVVLVVFLVLMSIMGVMAATGNLQTP